MYRNEWSLSHTHTMLSNLATHHLNRNSIFAVMQLPLRHHYVLFWSQAQCWGWVPACSQHGQCPHGYSRDTNPALGTNWHRIRFTAATCAVVCGPQSVSFELPVRSWLTWVRLSGYCGQSSICQDLGPVPPTCMCTCMCTCVYIYVCVCTHMRFVHVCAYVSVCV